MKFLVAGAALVLTVGLCLGAIGGAFLVTASGATYAFVKAITTYGPGATVDVNEPLAPVVQQTVGKPGVADLESTFTPGEGEYVYDWWSADVYVDGELRSCFKVRPRKGEGKFVDIGACFPP